MFGGERASIRPMFDFKKGTLKIHIPIGDFTSIDSDEESVDWYRQSKKIRRLIADEMKHAGQIVDTPDWESISKNPITYFGKRAGKKIIDRVKYGEQGRYYTKGTSENIHFDPERYNPILERYGITEQGDLIGKESETEEEVWRRLGKGKEYDASKEYILKFHDDEGNLLESIMDLRKKRADAARAKEEQREPGFKKGGPLYAAEGEPVGRITEIEEEEGYDPQLTLMGKIILDMLPSTEKSMGENIFDIATLAVPPAKALKLGKLADPLLDTGIMQMANKGRTYGGGFSKPGMTKIRGGNKDITLKTRNPKVWNVYTDIARFSDGGSSPGKLTPQQVEQLRKIMPQLRAAASSQTRHGRTTMNNVVRMFDDNFK
jgi:hypothetical protein